MRLKELRTSRNLLQREVASFLNCSQAVYSRYETGEREIPWELLVKLSGFYGVSVEYIMGTNDTESAIQMQKIMAKLKCVPEEKLHQLWEYVVFLSCKDKK